MAGLLNLIFSGLWMVFGSDPNIPQQNNIQWTTEQAWHQTANGYELKSSSKSIPEDCRKNPDAYLDFPVVIDGSHEIYFDGKLFLRFSSADSVRSIYGKPSIQCAELKDVSMIEWVASTDSKYFARFFAFPEIEASLPIDNFFNETLNIIAAGLFLVMGLFCFIIFAGKVERRLPIAFFAASIFCSIYFICTVPGLLSIKASLLTLHKIGDSSLTIGAAFIYAVFHFQGLISRRALKIYGALTIIAFLCQWTGRTGDEVQMGTNISFIPMLLSLLTGMGSLLINSRRVGFGRLAMFQLIGMGVFVIASFNDILIVSGSFDGYLLFSIGITGEMMFLAIGVNETISEAYKERDFLRLNLENEVTRKTSELESAMRELRHTQAELIQSAKLASIGTLSAGMAHEINNSVNFVSGAIMPLEKIIRKFETVSPRDFEMGSKLLAAVKDGVAVTVEVVRSLRQFSGVNQAKFKDIYLKDVVHSVTTLIRTRLKDNYSVTTDIPESLAVYGSVVAINQILMNLIVNALDAMPTGGTISIKGFRRAGAVVLEVTDTGTGIPEEIRSKIFDPFFTTKDVGAGTGLGLYIIVSEMKKCEGRVEVDSEVGKGTTFRLWFPEGRTSAAAPPVAS